VLSIGESILDSGFLSNAPTLAIQQIGRKLVNHGINRWRTPRGTTIVAAATNKTPRDRKALNSRVLTQ